MTFPTQKLNATTNAVQPLPQQTNVQEMQPHTGQVENPQTVPQQIEEEIDTRSHGNLLLPGNWQKQLDNMMNDAMKKAGGLFAQKYLEYAMPVRSTLNKADKKLYAVINQQYNDVQEALKKLDRLTGKDLAGAFEGDMEQNPTYKKVKCATDALLNLADTFRKNIANSPKVRELEAMALRCELRASELTTLTCEMVALADGEDTDERLKKKVSELLPPMMLKMHGNVDIMKHLKEKFRPLFERLDELEGSTSPANDLEIAKLCQDIKTMENVLRDAYKNGIQVKHDDKTVKLDMTDSILFGELQQLLKKADQRIRNFQDAFGTRAIHNHMDLIQLDYSNAPILTKYSQFTQDKLPVTFECINKLKEFKEEVKRLCTNSDATTEQLQNCIENFKQFCKEKYPQLKKERTNTDNLLELLKAKKKNAAKLRDELQKYVDVNDAKKMKEFCECLDDFYRNAQKKVKNLIRQKDNLFLKFTLPKILEIWERKTNNSLQETYSTKDNLHKLFNGKLKITAVVEARVNGADMDMINTNLVDENLIDGAEEQKGSGNTVKFCKYKYVDEDGKTQEPEFVFKDENHAHFSMHNLCLGKEGYADMQSVGYLNIASYKCAKLLGCKENIVESHLGVLQGIYGLFMEKAEGFNAVEVRTKEETIDGPEYDCLTKNELLELPENDFIDVKGQMMQQMNRLQWIDLFTGQGDRHNGNYKMKIDDDLNVTVKGIDNDMSFMDWRIGLTRIRVTGVNYEKLVKLGAAKYFEKHDKEQQTAEMDFAKIPDYERIIFQTSLGLLSPVKLPEYMDKSIYDALMKLDGEMNDNLLGNNPLDIIDKEISPEGMAAAKARLLELIDVAKKMKQEGRVISNNTWKDAAWQAQQDAKYFNQKKHFDKTKAIYKKIYYGMDIFYRDFGFMAKK